MHKPFRFGVIARGARSGPLWGENVRQAEELGYATWLVSDHPGRSLAPLTSLALAAAASTSLRPGSFVFCNDWRHPVLLAQEVATLDLLSGGRFELGLGAGHALNEYRQLGLPVDSAGTRIRRLEEAVRLIKQCLTPEPVSFSGTFYTVAGLEHQLQPLQRPHPPIFLGGGRKQMLRLSAREADIIGIAPKFGAQGVEASDVCSKLCRLIGRGVAVRARRAPAEKPGAGTATRDPTLLDLAHDKQGSSLKKTTVRSENR